MASASTARRSVVLVGVPVLIMAWTVANGLWLLTNRRGQPLNIDEAGYLGIALNYASGWERGGPTGWLESILYPSTHAPLTTAVTSLASLSGWDPRAVAFGVILAFAATTVAITAALASMARSVGVVLLSCIFLLSAPGFIALSRNFVFAIPAAAVTILALWTLARSRWLTGITWSIAFGVAVGLMPLARTMLIAFAPVMMCVAAVHAAGHPGQRKRQVVNFLVAGAVAVAVASTWLLPSARLVFGYLTDYGYGKHSAEYAGESESAPERLVTSLGQEFFLPHLLIVVVGWILLGWLHLRLTRGLPFRSRLPRTLASFFFPCAAFVVGASLALMTSENAGFGFTVPLMAPAVLVASIGWVRALRMLPQGLRVSGLAALVTVCVGVTYPLLDQDSWLAEQRTLRVLGGSVNVTAGQDTDTAYVFGSTIGSNPETTVRNRTAWGQEWELANEELTDAVLDESTERPDFAFGFRGRFVNVNTVQLEVIERLDYGVSIAQVDPAEWGRSRQDYIAWLTEGPAAGSCHLMISPGRVNEFTPLPLTQNLEGAAVYAGFEPVEDVRLPDGRKVSVWERSGGSC